MTNIATKLENDPALRARTITIVGRLMAIGAGVSLVGLAWLIHLVF